MADFSFEYNIEGAEKLLRYYENWGLLYLNFLRDFLQAAGIKIQEYTIANTNVGIHAPIYNMTGGSLRRSWTLTPVKQSGSVLSITLYADSAQAPYALYVEEGHRTLAYSPITGKRIVYQLPDGTWRAGKNGWVEGQHMARNAFEKVQGTLKSSYDIALKRFEERLSKGTK